MIWVYRLPDRRTMAGGRADRQGDGVPCKWREGEMEGILFVARNFHG